MNILLGITGGIAAYKACEFCSLSQKKGHDVKVIMTRNAQKFVGPITFEGLTGNTVLTDSVESGMDHIHWPKWANIFVIAPMSANTLAKIAHGLCDDLLTTSICATPQNTPILLCPAMNTHMWVHPATTRNRRLLEETQRYQIVQPIEKRLACGDVGIGALAEPSAILDECHRLCP